MVVRNAGAMVHGDASAECTRADEALVKDFMKSALSHKSSAARVEYPADVHAAAQRSGELNWKKIVANGAVEAAASFSTFGASGAAAAIFRANPKASATLKVLVSGLQPILAGAASAYVSVGIRQASGLESTHPSKYRALQDTMAPAGFLAGAELFRTKVAPALKPLTQLSGAAKVATAAAGGVAAAAGNFVGTAGREAFAQSIPSDKEAPPRSSAHQQAIGRGFSQVAAGTVAKVAALQGVAGVAPIAQPYVVRAMAVGFANRRFATGTEHLPNNTELNKQERS